MTVAAYPGSFNPPTVAHLAIALAAHRQGGFDQVEFVLSEIALGKETLARPSVVERAEVLRQAAASRPWLAVGITPAQLLCDIADGYDGVVLGADKWAQVLDPFWYGGSLSERDRAIERLPLVLVVARAAHALAEPPSGIAWQVLVVDDVYLEVSSSAVRSGRREWMIPEAAEHDRRTGVWAMSAAYPDQAMTREGLGAPGGGNL